MRTIYLLLLLFASTAEAGQNLCFDEAARIAGVDRDLLKAIATQESSLKTTAFNRNKDGTVDIGPMQVNSSHLPLLRLAGFTEKDLYVPCTNVKIGAVLLKECIRVHGNVWRAVGAYHTGHRASREGERKVYVGLVSKWYYRLKSKQSKG